MYTYSGWVGAQWKNNTRKNWERWCQKWERNTFPPVIPSNSDVTQALQRLMNNNQPNCLSHAAHEVQVNLPSEASNPEDRPSGFQYTII